MTHSGVSATDRLFCDMAWANVQLFVVVQTLLVVALSIVSRIMHGVG